MVLNGLRFQDNVLDDTWDAPTAPTLLYSAGATALANDRQVPPTVGPGDWIDTAALLWGDLAAAVLAR